MGELVRFVCRTVAKRFRELLSEQSKTLLLGLDGATFTILDSMMAAWESCRASAARRARRARDAPDRDAATHAARLDVVDDREEARAARVFDFLQKEAPTSEHFRLTSSNDIQHRRRSGRLASDHDLRVIWR